MIECGFFDSVDRDRLYKAEAMTRPYELLVSNGVFATPQGTPSDYLQVYANEGMTVTVKAGRGLFKDKWFISDSDITLTLDASEVTLNRIDSIIVKIDTSESVRAGTIEIKKGTPASDAVAPVMERSSDVHEYRLADITVNPQATAIEQLNIADKRGSVDCPWITSLVQQVDTSTLFAQWEDAYTKQYDKVESEFSNLYTETETTCDTLINDTQTATTTLLTETETKCDNLINESNEKFDTYYTEETEQFNTWFDDIKNTIKTTTLVRSYNSYYVTTNADETVIPINISEFNGLLDVLMVYINGLMLIEDVDYTIGTTDITLTKGVDVGTPISFVLLKSVDGSEAETVVSEVGTLQTKVAELEARIAALESQ